MHRKHLVNVSKMQISMESVSAVGPQTRVSEVGPPEVILRMQGRVTKGRERHHQCRSWPGALRSLTEQLSPLGAVCAKEKVLGWDSGDMGSNPALTNCPWVLLKQSCTISYHKLPHPITWAKPPPTPLQRSYCGFQMRTWMLKYLPKYKVPLLGASCCACDVLWKESISYHSPWYPEQLSPRSINALKPPRNCLARSDKLKKVALAGSPLTFQTRVSFNPAILSAAVSWQHPSAPVPHSALLSPSSSSGREQPYITH